MTKGHEVTGSAAAPSGIPRMAERPGRPEPLPTVPDRAPAADVHPPANGKPASASGRKKPAKPRAASGKVNGPTPSAAKLRAAANGARKAVARSSAGKAKDGPTPAQTPPDGAAEPAAAQPAPRDAETENETQRLHDLEIIERIVPETKPRGLLGISFGTIHLDRIEEKLFASSEDSLARDRANRRKPVLSFLKRVDGSGSTGERATGAARPPDRSIRSEQPERDAEAVESKHRTAVPALAPKHPRPAKQSPESDADDTSKNRLAFVMGLLRLGRPAPESSIGGEDTAPESGQTDADGGKPAPLLGRLALLDRLNSLAGRARTLLRKGPETVESKDAGGAESTAEPAAAHQPDAAATEPVPDSMPPATVPDELPVAKAQDPDEATAEAPSSSRTTEDSEVPAGEAVSPEPPAAAEPAAEAEEKAHDPLEPAGPAETKAEAAKETPAKSAKPGSTTHKAAPAPVFAHFQSLESGPDDYLAFAEIPSADPPNWPETGTVEPEWRARAEQVLSQAAALARELEADAAARAGSEADTVSLAPEPHELAEAVPIEQADAPPLPDAEPLRRFGPQSPQQLRLDLNAESRRLRQAAELSITEPAEAGEDAPGADGEHMEAEADRPFRHEPVPPPFPDIPAAEESSRARRRAGGFRPIERRSLLFPDPDPQEDATDERAPDEHLSADTGAEGMAEGAPFNPFAPDPDAAGTSFGGSYWGEPPEALSGPDAETDGPAAQHRPAHKLLLDPEAASSPHENDDGVHGWLRSRVPDPPLANSDPPHQAEREDTQTLDAPEPFAGMAEPEQDAPDPGVLRGGGRQSAGEPGDDAFGEFGGRAEVRPAGERWTDRYDEYEEAAAAAGEWRTGDEDNDDIVEESPDPDIGEDDPDRNYGDEQVSTTEVVKQLNVLSRPSGRPERAAGVMRGIARTATEYYAVPERWPSAAKLGGAGIVVGGLLGYLIHTLLGLSSVPPVALIIAGAQIAGALGFYRGYTNPFTPGSNVTRNRPAKPRRRAKSEAWERMDHAPRMDDGYPDDPESFARAFEEGRLPPPRPRASRKNSAATAPKRPSDSKPHQRRKGGRRRRR